MFRTFESGLRTEEGLNEMAKSHSERMAIEGRRSQFAVVSSKDRYDDDRPLRPMYVSKRRRRVHREPDRNRFEAVEKTVAGQPYEEGGEERFHATDKEVARKIVDDCMAWPDYRERLTLRNADIVGIGVEITDTRNVSRLPTSRLTVAGRLQPSFHQPTACERRRLCYIQWY